MKDLSCYAQPGNQADGLLQREGTGVRVDASQAEAVAHQELHRVRIRATALEFAHKTFAETVMGLDVRIGAGAASCQGLWNPANPLGVRRREAGMLGERALNFLCSYCRI